MNIHHLIVPQFDPVELAEGPLFSVRLIDRRTGAVPRLNGIPLSLLTRSPRQAVSNLMRGRNRAVWRAEVESVGPQAPRRS